MSSLIDYLYACEAAKKNRKIIFVLVLWCYTHLLVTVKRKISDLVPRATYPMSPARASATNVIGCMSRTTEVEDAVQIWKIVVIVTVAKHYTPFVEKSVDAISIRYSCVLYLPHNVCQIQF